MFDGLEVDMLSLGDGDSIIVTEWTPFGPQRILIDGGTEGDADVVKEFLVRRKFGHLWAVVCTHLHGDHASGLIKLVRDKSIGLTTGWIHDIRKHVSADALRRACAGNSSEAEAVRQVLETTKELASAFASRGISPQEPFAGSGIAGYPFMVVLSPDMAFYRSVLAEFTNVHRSPGFPGLISALAGLRPAPAFPSLATMLPAPPGPAAAPAPYPTGVQLSSLLTGALSNSSVKENPTTQPFNNTSVILGVQFDGNRLMFTADAGSDAFARVPPDWNHLLWMQVPHHGSDGNLSQEDIERFCPKFANVSACGDTSHPSRAIVSGLVKVGTQVFSTHQSGHLWFHIGNVPDRADYSPAVPLRGTGKPKPVVDLARLLYGGLDDPKTPR